MADYDYRPGGSITSAVTSGGLRGTAMMDAPKAIERDTIGSALDDQTQRLSRLIDILNQLEARLIPVLGPSPAETGAQNAPPSPNGFREVVRMNNHIIAHAHARIGELLDRLHL